MAYFSTKATATAALKSMEPHVELKDRKIYAEWPLPKSQNRVFTHSKTLHVNNIPEDLKAEDLTGKLEKYGKIVRTVFARTLKGAKRKDFAFVEFENKDQANTAMEQEKTLEFDGKKVVLSKAKERDDRRERFVPPGRFPPGGRGPPPGRGFMRGPPPGGYGGPGGRGPPPPRDRSRSNERMGGDLYERRTRGRGDFGDRDDRGRPGGPKRRGFDAPPPGPEPRGPPPHRGERSYGPPPGPRDQWDSRPEPRRDAGPPPSR